MWFIVGVNKSDCSIKLMNENRVTRYVSSEEIIDLYESDNLYGIIKYYCDEDDDFINEYLFYIFPEYTIRIQSTEDIEPFLKNNIKEVLAGHSSVCYNLVKVKLDDYNMCNTLLPSNTPDGNTVSSINLLSIFRDNLDEQFCNWSVVHESMFIDADCSIILHTQLEDIEDKYRRYFSKYRYDGVFNHISFIEDSWYFVNRQPDCYCLCDMFKLFSDKSSIKVIKR